MKVVLGKKIRKKVDEQQYLTLTLVTQAKRIWLLSCNTLFSHRSKKCLHLKKWLYQKKNSALITIGKYMLLKSTTEFNTVFCNSKSLHKCPKKKIKYKAK